MLKNKHMIIRYLLILLMLVAFSCSNNSEKPVTDSRPGKDEIADLNRYLVQKDKERIQNYINRKNLRMTESPTGLWYQINKEGTGEKLTDNSTFMMEYECMLLDGTKCYSSEKLGPKKIILGKTEIEPGLNEGLRTLKPGAEAIFILPPYLGYGLVGDQNRIPSRAIIVYYVNILQNE